MTDTRTRVTEIVGAIDADRSTDPAASAEELMPLVYDELRRIAGAYLARERPDHTLQPTAVVHEAFLRLVDQRRVRWRGRTHFLAVGAQMMRRVLVDYARQRKRRKRGGDWQRVSLSDDSPDRVLDLEDLLALDAALDRLAELDPRQAKVVELRFFAGFRVADTARLLGISQRTAEGDWTHARAWLRRELARSSTDPV